jgi:hypothetical protein
MVRLREKGKQTLLISMLHQPLRDLNNTIYGIISIALK